MIRFSGEGVISADECRQRVRECLERAMERKGPERHTLVASSRSWSQLANEIEEYQTFLSDWAGEVSDGAEAGEP